MSDGGFALSLGPTARRHALLWRVDPARDASELDRFWAKVVRGPGRGDCWVWIGAISDDGYGRFQIRRNGAVRVVRPNRYALAVAFGLHLDEFEVAEHAVCDVPLCVRVVGDGADHVWASTQSANLARMGWRSRGGGAAWARRFRGVTRADRAAASRRLRDAVRDGWDSERIAAALDSSDAPQLPLG